MSVWVVFRSQADSARLPDGTELITQLRGFLVDSDISPNGGLVLREVRVSSPIMFDEQTTQDARGNIIAKRIPRQLKVLRVEEGADKDWNRNPSKNYICEPDRKYAEYLASMRPDWYCAEYRSEADIPRKGAPRQYAAPTDEKTEVETDTEPTAEDTGEVETSPSSEVEALKARAKELMDAGARIIIAQDFLYPKVRKVREEAGLSHVILTSYRDTLPDSPSPPCIHPCRGPRSAFRRPWTYWR